MVAGIASVALMSSAGRSSGVALRLSAGIKVVRETVGSEAASKKTEVR